VALDLYTRSDIEQSGAQTVDQFLQKLGALQLAGTAWNGGSVLASYDFGKQYGLTSPRSPRVAMPLDHRF
jgi:hypothetical protein